MYRVFFTEDYVLQLKKKTSKNKELKLQAQKTTKLAALDITHPSPRLHKLSGADIWSISVNKSIRIIISIDGDIIYFLEIGSHDEVY